MEHTWKNHLVTANELTKRLHCGWVLCDTPLSQDIVVFRLKSHNTDATKKKRDAPEAKEKRRRSQKLYNDANTEVAKKNRQKKRNAPANKEAAKKCRTLVAVL